MRKTRLLCITWLIASAWKVPGDSTDHMPLGTPTDPPRGLRDMCGRDPRTCWDLGHPPPSPALGEDQQVNLLKDVERKVNSEVEQRTDAEISGQSEVWRMPGTGKGAEGDCEDLALQKMHDLLHRGFPKARLFLAVGYQHDVGLHTVLVASTQNGDVVLDNRSPYLSRWTDTPYSWVARQRPGRLMEWYSANPT